MNSVFEQLSQAINPFLFLLFALMIRCLLIMFYSGAIYLIIWTVKTLLGAKMSVRANYYSWYALLLSLPLSGFAWNNAVKLPLYGLYFASKAKLVCQIAALVWFVIILLRVALQMRLSHRARCGMKQMELFSDNDNMVLQAATAVGLRPGRVEVLVTDSVCSPMSYGVAKKTILLPQDYRSRYSTSELYLLLLHEMAHIRNHDTVKLHLINLVGCFIWLPKRLDKQFRSDTEILCDNRIMGLQAKGRNAYGDLLLKECSGGIITEGVAFSDSYHILRQRIDALYQYKPERHKLALFGGVVLFSLLLSMGWQAIHRADWMNINDGYNRNFKVVLVCRDAATGGHRWISPGDIGPDGEIPADLQDFYARVSAEMLGLEILPPVNNGAFHNVFSVDSDVLRVDKLALQKAIESLNLPEGTVESVNFYTISYTMYMSYETRNLMTSGSSFYTISTNELEHVDEGNQYHTEKLENRAIEGYLYNLAAHWA